MAVLGPHSSCTGSFLVAVGQVFSSCSVWGLLSRSGMRASHCSLLLLRAWALGHAGLVIVVHGLSWLVASGILVPWPGIRSTYPTLWQADPQPTEPPCKSLRLQLLFALIGKNPTFQACRTTHRSCGSPKFPQVSVSACLSKVFLLPCFPTWSKKSQPSKLCHRASIYETHMIIISWITLFP